MPNVPHSEDYGPSVMGQALPSIATAARIGGSPEIGEGISQIGTALTREGLALQSQLAEQYRRDKVTVIRTEMSKRANQRRLDLIRNPGDPMTMVDRFREGSEADLNELTNDIDDGETRTRIREAAIPLLDNEAQNLQVTQYGMFKDFAIQADKSRREEVARSMYLSGNAEERKAILDSYVNAPSPFFSPADKEAARKEIAGTVDYLHQRDAVDTLVQQGRFDDARKEATDLARYPNATVENIQKNLEYIRHAAATEHSSGAREREKAAKEARADLTNQITGALLANSIAREKATSPEQVDQLDAEREKIVENIDKMLPRLAGTLSPGQFNTIRSAVEGSLNQKDDDLAVVQVQNYLGDQTKTPIEKQDFLDEMFYGKRRISKEFYLSSSRIPSKEREAVEPPPIEKQLHDQLMAPFQTRRGDDASAMARVKADVEAEWSDFLRGGDRTNAELEAKVEQIHRERNVITKASTLPIPDALRDAYRESHPKDPFRGNLVTRDMALTALERIMRSPLSTAETTRQVEQIRRWVEVAERNDQLRARVQEQQ